jgi:hypothetical protein
MRGTSSDLMYNRPMTWQEMTALKSSDGPAEMSVADDPRWARVVARDRLADGQFWYSVMTTGVYCRPSCPSRTANPKNVQLHDTLEAAKATGFRACKRCNPDGLSADRENAAGHRPCFLCRRKAAEAFRAAWAKAKGGAEPTAGEMDAALHTERLISGRRRRHALRSNIVDLPDGAIVSLADEAFTIAKGKAFRWTENGYDQPQTNLHADGLLTPPSSLVALEAGYRPVVHPTIGATT